MTSRAAQRAFRERKQSQLAELQARVQQYEQGEIERNVALQNIAKRLKEENEDLRRENRQLKEQLLTFEQDLEPSKTDRKRNRIYSPLSDVDPIKKSKPSLDPPETHVRLGSYYNNPSPRSITISSGSNDTSDSLSSEGQADMPQSPTLNLWQFPPAGRLIHLDGMSFSCGLCREDTLCVCREFVVPQAQVAQSGTEYKVSNTYELPSTSSDPNPQPPHAELIPPPCMSGILEKLPDYQPPIPLRRKPGLSSGNTVFAVGPPTPQPVKCSGDPTNCGACADDAFGKAFCGAIKESVSKSLPCLNCTCERGRFVSDSLPGSRTDSQAQLSMRAPPVHPLQPPEMIPTNDAWRQLKSHPNVAFTDLSLLADVVARRSKCDASVDIPPTSLESIDTPSLKGFPIPHDHASATEMNRERNSGGDSPRLVPQDVLLRCARERVREVETDAVRAALRFLDAKFV